MAAIALLGSPKNRRKKGEAVSHWRNLNWQRIATIAGLLAVLALGAGGISWLLDQPIETVAVQGRFQRVSAPDVERAVRDRVIGAGLVSVNLGNVQRAIQALPWVEHASVQRSWPHGLTVSVTEQVAAARWGANGLLNARGDLFKSESRHIPQELPQLAGPIGSERQVAQRYFAVQGRLVEAGMRITSLRLDARGAWAIDLDNGVVVRLGRRQVDERFERFIVAALKLVAQRAAEIQYVDMRYTNGFAVGWKTGGAQVAHGAHPDDDSADA